MPYLYIYYALRTERRCRWARYSKTSDTTKGPTMPRIAILPAIARQTPPYIIYRLDLLILLFLIK